jgi:hypothetical protein
MFFDRAKRSGGTCGSFGQYSHTLLLWIQRNLHVGVGTAAAQIGPFTIQSMEPPDTIGKSKTRALAKIRLFAAETPVFPANIWKPGLEPINIKGRGATRDLTPVTPGSKSHFSLGTSDSQFLE